MTKAKLSRLIFLESLHGLNGSQIEELLALQSEFEAWQLPDLRRLLEMAEEVGYAKREWREAVEKFEATGRHPHYETKALTERLYYDELRATLYAAAGIPAAEEDTP